MCHYKNKGNFLQKKFMYTFYTKTLKFNNKIKNQKIELCLLLYTKKKIKEIIKKQKIERE